MSIRTHESAKRSHDKGVAAKLGHAVWRDTTFCGAAVVGVTAQAVVCADANGTRVIDMAAKARWQAKERFVAITDDRVILADASVRDAATGRELARVTLPADIG